MARRASAARQATRAPRTKAVDETLVDGTEDLEPEAVDVEETDVADETPDQANPLQEAPETTVPTVDDTPPPVTDRPEPADAVTTAVTTADTTLTDADRETNEFRAFWADYVRRSGVHPPEGQILYPGEPFTFSGKLPKGEDFIVLQEPIYRLVVPFRSRRPIFTLEATAGTRINKVQAANRTQYEATTRRLLEGLR